MSNNISKSASVYQRMYNQYTKKRFWISPGVNRKFIDLDIRLEELEIDAENYVEFCVNQYPPNKNYRFVPIATVCGNVALNRYQASHTKIEKFTDRDYIWSVLLSIEPVVAHICVKAYTLEYWDPNADLSDYFDDLEDYCNSEFGVIYDGEGIYEQAKYKYSGMYDKVVEKITTEICTKNHIPYSPDYRQIALMIVERKEHDRRHSQER